MLFPSFCILPRSKSAVLVVCVVIQLAILSISLFLCIVVFSLVLAIMGSGWPFIAPLFITAEAVLIFTFPTKKKLDKWQEKSN